VVAPNAQLIGSGVITSGKIVAAGRTVGPRTVDGPADAPVRESRSDITTGASPELSAQLRRKSAPFEARQGASSRGAACARSTLLPGPEGSAARQGATTQAMHANSSKARRTMINVHRVSCFIQC